MLLSFKYILAPGKCLTKLRRVQHVAMVTKPKMRSEIMASAVGVMRNFVKIKELQTCLNLNFQLLFSLFIGSIVLCKITNDWSLFLALLLLDVTMSHKQDFKHSLRL